MKRINPIAEAALYAVSTTVGIVVGTVIATYVVERMRGNALMPSSSTPPSLPPSTPSQVV
jgi:hypothetical protein